MLKITRKYGILYLKINASAQRITTLPTPASATDSITILW